MKGCLTPEHEKEIRDTLKNLNTPLNMSEVGVFTPKQLKNHILMTFLYVLNIALALYQVHIQNYAYAIVYVMAALWVTSMVKAALKTAVQEQSLQRIIELLEQIREGGERGPKNDS